MVAAKAVAQNLHVVEAVEQRYDQLRLGLDALERVGERGRLGRDQKEGHGRAQLDRAAGSCGEFPEAHTGNGDTTPLDDRGGLGSGDDRDIFAGVRQQCSQEAADSAGAEDRERGHGRRLADRVSTNGRSR